MQLAHTLGENGPEIEFLIIAAAMLVLGVIFFLQRSVKPVVSVVLVLGALALGAGAFAVGGSDDGTNEGCEASEGSSGDMSLAIAAPADGSTIQADEPISLDIELEGASGDASGGHFDVSVDGQLETMTPDPDPQISFEPGEHELVVEYVNVQHESFDPPVIACVMITAE